MTEEPRPIEVLLNVAIMELPGIAEALQAQAKRLYDAAVAQDKEIEQLREEVGVLSGDVDHSIENGKKLRAEIERLRAALTFYANPVVYVDDSVPDRFAMQTWPVMRDSGKRAREALKAAPPGEIREP